MNAQQLFRAIGSVDGDLVAEAETASKKRPALRLIVARAGMAAACLTIVAALGVHLLTPAPQTAPEPFSTTRIELPPAESPAGIRKFFNYGGYRYAFCDDGAPFALSAYSLETPLGTLAYNVMDGPDDQGEDFAVRDFATTFALGGTLYEIPGYSPAFRIAVDLGGSRYMAELVGRVDGMPLGADYYINASGIGELASRIDLLPHMGGEPVALLAEGDEAKSAVRILADATDAALQPEDYEAIAAAQSTGQSWRMAVGLSDGTAIYFYILPDLSLISIGDDYYSLPGEFLSRYGDAFTGLEQPPLPAF